MKKKTMLQTCTLCGRTEVAQSTYACLACRSRGPHQHPGPEDQDILREFAPLSCAEYKDTNA